MSRGSLLSSTSSLDVGWAPANYKTGSGKEKKEVLEEEGNRRVEGEEKRRRRRREKRKRRSE